MKAVLQFAVNVGIVVTGLSGLASAVLWTYLYFSDGPVWKNDSSVVDTHDDDNSE